MTITAVCVLGAAALLAAGCGDEGGATGPAGSLGAPSAEQQRQDYLDAMSRLQTAIEAPEGPSFQQSIDTGNKQQLMAAAARWDSATAIASSAVPPKDIAAAHKDVVEAMRGLGDWNRKIAAAAPNKAKTKRIAAQARASEDAKQFDAAMTKIEQAGYLEAQGDPLDDAGPPTQ